MPTLGSSSKQTGAPKNTSAFPAQKNYHEIVEFLDTHWTTSPATAQNLEAVKALDKALDFPSKKVTAILVAGTNGKSLTIHFATKLFQEEKIACGALYSPHILSYNERFIINNETISNKHFTEIMNEVISAAQLHNLQVSTQGILVVAALVYFAQQKIDVALFEMQENSPFDPATICFPHIFAVTRITDDVTPKSEATLTTIQQLMQVVKENTHVISGDQSKLNLQIMAETVRSRGGIWSMPIRKLAPLPNPFEQLQGRCAVIAERICQRYVDNFAHDNNTIILSNGLLAKPEGKRGRPPLKLKEELRRNPRKTLEQFWKETANTLPARFQILDKEKPTILLDNASNVDALKNLLLGIRLLHYQRPLKGLTFIFGCDARTMNTEEFLRLLRYFSKKNSGQVIFCPIEPNLPGIGEVSWNVEQITNDVRSLKIKAKSAASFEEAFDLAKKSVDERHGLVVISGSKSIVVSYWKHKDIKKISCR